MSQLRIILVGVCWLGILLFCNSCYLTIPKAQRTCYKQLQQFTEIHWVRDSNNLIVPTRTTYDFVFGKLPVFECAKKLDQRQLIKIFGEPNEITNSNLNWYYFISREGGTNFNFHFNSEMKLYSIANEVKLKKEILVSPKQE